MSERPKWDFPLTIDQVKKMDQTIKNIHHKWKYTSEDTTENWIEFETAQETFRAPFGWEKLFQFKPDHAGLIAPTYEGERAIKVVSDIEAWEKSNSRELAEYRRLKAKFEADQK